MAGAAAGHNPEYATDRTDTLVFALRSSFVAESPKKPMLPLGFHAPGSPSGASVHASGLRAKARRDSRLAIERRAASRERDREMIGGASPRPAGATDTSEDDDDDDDDGGDDDDNADDQDLFVSPGRLGQAMQVEINRHRSLSLS